MSVSCVNVTTATPEETGSDRVSRTEAWLLIWTRTRLLLPLSPTTKLLQRVKTHTRCYSLSSGNTSSPIVLTAPRTFDVDLGGGVVRSDAVGRHAGVASRVVLEGFGDHQRVEVAVPPDLDVGGVVELAALTEPPGGGGWP